MVEKLVAAESVVMEIVPPTATVVVEIALITGRVARVPVEVKRYGGL